MRRYQRFWLEFAVPRAKLALFRFAFFALVGVDAFLQISHAPRYGAGGFNVAHIAGLDAILPGPSRAGMLALFLLQAYLGFVIACGVAGRAWYWLLTALYGYTYFISQLDSYQHHYLVFLILLLCGFVPWQDSGAVHDRSKERERRSREARARAEQPARIVTSWALRLVYAQITLLYLWAAAAKLDPAWLDGTTLAAQLEPGTLRGMAEWMGLGSAAVLVMLAELFLAVAWLVRKLWLPGLIVGVALHIGIEIAGFEIGIFSYFMLVMYALLIPDRWFAAFEKARAAIHARARNIMGALASKAALSWIAMGAMLGTGAVLMALLPFAEGPSVAALAAVLGIAACLWALFRHRPAEERSWRAAFTALAHLLACATVMALYLTTDQAHDYYKYWGGSSRRLGNWEEARIAYQKLAELSPDYASAHYHLGTIAEREGRTDDALASYRRAQRANPTDHRPFLQEAEIHHKAGRGAEVLSAVSRVLELSPKDQQARARAQELYRQWAEPGTSQ